MINDIITPVRAEACAFLYFTLKGKWYDMILCGRKREEYRDFKPYWGVRFRHVAAKANALADGNGKPIVVCAFSRGRKKADLFFECEGIAGHTENSYRCTNPPHEAWGEPHAPHYVIKLGRRVQPIRNMEAHYEGK